MWCVTKIICTAIVRTILDHRKKKPRVQVVVLAREISHRFDPVFTYFTLYFSSRTFTSKVSFAWKQYVRIIEALNKFKQCNDACLVEHKLCEKQEKMDS